MTTDDPNGGRIPLAELSGGLEGDWTSSPPETVTGVRIDSRECGPGDLFVGLPGEHTHGQRFVEDAAEAGAVAALVEENQDHALPQWVVEVAERTLGDLAAAYRRTRIDGPVVGITGSSGKTTTREMIRRALEALGEQPGVTEGNQNNQLGLPITILNRGHRSPLVAEAGINQLGEIDRLIEILQPTVGVVTTIGPSHVEGMESRERVAREKGKLLAAVEADKALIPASIECKPILIEVAGRPIEVAAKRINQHELELLCERSGNLVHRWDIPDPGLESPFQEDAILALAAVGVLGKDPAPGARALAGFEPLKGRGRVVEFRGLRILDGSYNANPQSMEKALDRLEALPGPRTAVLGTMKELGEQAEQFHYELGRSLADRTVDTIWFVGEYGEAVRSGTGDHPVNLVDTPEDLPELSSFGSGSVLVKASHSVGLHRWLDEGIDSP